VSPPFLASRDATLRVAWEPVATAEGEGYRQTWHLAPERAPPPRAGVRRAAVSDGWWELAPVEGGRRTRVRLRAVFDEEVTWLTRGVIAGAVQDAFDAVATAASAAPR
jgi:hypothetical protein